MGLFSNLKEKRRSLTYTTLTSVGLRIGVLVIATASLTYLHLSNQIEKSSLQTLEKYVQERSRHEREIFRLAEDNQKQLRLKLNEEFRKIEASTADPIQEYLALVQKSADGAMRSPKSKPGVKKDVDIWVAKTAKTTPIFRRKVVTFSKILSHYGPAFHTRFTDTYIALGENANLVYWPEFPDWSYGTEAGFYFPSFELYQINETALNPERKTMWSGVYYDPAVKAWMVSASTPFDDSKGNFAGIIGHDLLVDDLLKRTNNEALPGTYNILIHRDGRVIAHPEKMDEIFKGEGKTTVSDMKDPVLQSIFDEVSRAPASERDGDKIIDHKKFDQFIAASYWSEPGWYLITIYPKALIRQIANRTAMYIILLGLISLILELTVLYVIFRDKVSKPLTEFVQATHDLEAGKESTPLQIQRQDEIGTLSRAFESMATKIRRANDILREKIDQRTRELQEAKRVATQNAHAAGMAEIATNILHNIGNTINSVNLSADEVRMRLENPELAKLEKALKLIEENRSRLADYLVNDAKGKMLPEYLAQLSKSIMQSRETSVTTFQYMVRKIKMIEDIVTSQQKYVKSGSFVEDVDMHQVVNETIGMLNLGNSRDNFRLITHFDQMPPVRAQRVKVMQIVMNLVKNAMDAIAFEELSKYGEIEITLAPQGSEAVLTVRDNGAGVAKENLLRIFNHGFTTKKNGHGFGLHYCANAATEIGGSLTAESPGEGKGAVFTLRLPMAAAVSEAVAA